MKDDPKAPTKVPDLLKAVHLLGGISTFHGEFGVQLQSKLKMFCDMEGHGMPAILDDKGDLEEFNSQKDELGGLLLHFKYEISLEDYTMFSTIVDDMIGIEVNMDAFVKEARILMDVRYNQHNTKVEKLLDIQWPTEEEYNTWLEKFKN